MKLLKVIFLISIFVIPCSLLAQEDEDHKSKRVMGKNKENKSIIVDVSLGVGINSNVYRTPEGIYTDPETGTSNQSDPISASFVNSDLELDWRPINKKKKEMALVFSYDGTFYSGDTNASNANGYDAGLEMNYVLKSKKKFNAKKHGRSTKNNKSTLRQKHKFGIFLKNHKFNYLHRGTGALRVTKVSKSEEENRYTYAQTGLDYSYTRRWRKHSRLGLSLDYYMRDYEEVGSFGSYDRKVIKLKAKYNRNLNKRWKWSVADKYAIKNYDTHEANDATGLSVAGTLRKYLENKLAIEFNRKTKSTKWTFGYQNFDRNDTYAGYWSYNQNKLFVEFDYIFSESRLLSLSYSTAQRQYKLETNPDGDIRDRTTNNMELVFETKHNWGDLNYTIESSDQADKDPYYTYKRNIYGISYLKEF